MSDLALTPVAEVGDIVSREELSGGESNPLVSLAPLVSHVPLLESFPLSLKPIMLVQNLLNARMADCLVVANSGYLLQEVSDEEGFVDPRL